MNRSIRPLTMPRRRTGWPGQAVLWALLLLPLLPLLTGCIGDKEPDPEQTTLVRAGDTAPDFTVELLDGEQVTLSGLRSKVVLLTFWASWCPTCQAEMQVVGEQIVERFADAPFTFLPVSRAETREAVSAFLDKAGLEFPVGLDPDGSIYARYASSYIPRHYLIDATGTVVYESVDYTPEKFATLIASIEETLRAAH